MGERRDRIAMDDRGVDDVVIHDVDVFRLERMGDTSFWLKCYKSNGEEIVFWINRKGRGIAVDQE